MADVLKRSLLTSISVFFEGVNKYHELLPLLLPSYSRMRINIYVTEYLY